MAIPIPALGAIGAFSGAQQADSGFLQGLSMRYQLAMQQALNASQIAKNEGMADFYSGRNNAFTAAYNGGIIGTDASGNPVFSALPTLGRNQATVEGDYYRMGYGDQLHNQYEQSIAPSQINYYNARAGQADADALGKNVATLQTAPVNVQLGLLGAMSRANPQTAPPSAAYSPSPLDAARINELRSQSALNGAHGAVYNAQAPTVGPMAASEESARNAAAAAATANANTNAQRERAYAQGVGSDAAYRAGMLNLGGEKLGEDAFYHNGLLSLGAGRLAKQPAGNSTYNAFIADVGRLNAQKAALLARRDKNGNAVPLTASEQAVIQGDDAQIQNDQQQMKSWTGGMTTEPSGMRAYVPPAGLGPLPVMRGAPAPAPGLRPSAKPPMFTPAQIRAELHRRGITLK